MLIEQDQQLFTRSRSVVSRVVAGETLIVPVRAKVGDLASIYSFNGTGSLLWRLLDMPTGLTDLINAVEREYEVSPEQAAKDVMGFVEELLSAGLVEVCQDVAMPPPESKGQMMAKAAGSR